MADHAKQNCAAYLKFVDAYNTGDFEKIEAAGRNLMAPDFKLHNINNPDVVSGVEDELESYKINSETRANRVLTFEDCFGAGDMVAVRAKLEFIDVATNEQKKVEFIFISHFRDGKLVEEWVS